MMWGPAAPTPPGLRDLGELRNLSSKPAMLRGRRYAAQFLPTVWTEFSQVLLNRNQAMRALIAVILLKTQFYFYPKTDLPKLTLDWKLWAASLLVAVSIWMIISVIRSPFLIIAEERKLGTWHGLRFVFHQPYLLKAIYCKATGSTEMYRFKSAFLRPNDFVNYFMTMEPNVRSHASWGLGGAVISNPIGAALWPGTGGIRTADNGDLILQLKLKHESVSTTVRIFCSSIVVGNLVDDADGLVGDYKFPAP